MRTHSFSHRTIWILALTLGAALPSQGGVLDDLRASISSLWTRQASQRQQARVIRARATSVDARADALHARLDRTQRAMLNANGAYLNYWHQMRRTEAELVRARHQRHIVTQRYNRRRILFGRRLAAMQRVGRLGRLQLLLGSGTLSDLTRRVYLFNALTTRDAQLQAELKQSKSEFERAGNALMAQWHTRNRLQLAANRERERIVQAAGEQQSTLRELAAHRYALLSETNEKIRESHEAGENIARLSSRRDEIIDDYQEAAARREAQERDEARERERQRSSHRRSSRRRSYARSNDDGDGERRSSRRGYRRERSASYRRRYTSSQSRPRFSIYKRTRERNSNRVRYVPEIGFELKPMPIGALIRRDEMSSSPPPVAPSSQLSPALPRP